MKFYSKSAFDDFADKLTELYDFKGKKNSTISASTTTEGQKVTLTLYRTQKLLIQGVSAKLWKSTEFQKLSFMFNQSENHNLITEGVNEQTPSRKQPTIVHETHFHGSFPPKYNKNSSSPLGIFSKLFGSTPIQGSPSNNSNANNSVHDVSPIFSKKNKQRISTPENYKNKVQNNHKKKHIFVDNEITFLKQPFQREHDSVLSENPDQTDVSES